MAENGSTYYYNHTSQEYSDSLPVIPAINRQGFSSQLVHGESSPGGPKQSAACLGLGHQVLRDDIDYSLGDGIEQNMEYIGDKSVDEVCVVRPANDQGDDTVHRRSLVPNTRGSHSHYVASGDNSIKVGANRHRNVKQ